MTASGRSTVLIADNSKLHREVMRDFYVELGLTVRLAADGIEALMEIERERPDLLVLDLIMPRIDGAQICSWIRGRETYRDIPVIILSGILSDEIEGIESIKADAFMAKMPIDKIGEELRALSEDLLAGPRPARPRIHGFEKMYRREVVQELLAERRTRSAIMDSISEGIAELSADRRLLRSNQAFERICGHPLGELLSRRLDDVFPECGPVLTGLMSALERGEPVATTTLRHADKELQIKLHRVEPPQSAPGIAVTEPAAGVSYALLVDDISHRVRIEQDRARLQSRLAQSEKMSAIGHFVAGAAHELNNPLTSVLGYAQLMLEKHPENPIRAELEKIVAGGARCKAIVDNLMTFARRISARKSHTDINGLLLEAISAHRERLLQLGARLDLDLAPDLPPTLAASEMLTRAIEQVVDNAVTAIGEINGSRWMSIATARRGEKIRITIKDSGPGIPEENLGRIFDPFFTTRQVGMGSGLGLAVTYGIVTDHGGRITASNAPGGGAALTIELPLSPAGARGPVAEGTDGPESENRDRRVLIIENEVAVVEQLADVLENFDHHIETVAVALDGLRRIQEEEYDLILVDVALPDTTPDQLYDELSRNCPESLDRVVFIASQTFDDRTREFLSRNRSRHLERPFSIQKIVEMVRAVMNA